MTFAVGIDSQRLAAAYAVARDALLAERNADGFWSGELSTSALSTATAVSALARVDATAHAGLIAGGLAWLAVHQNADGGWGDTTKSLSNISTTMLCRAAFHIGGAANRHADSLNRADSWIAQRYGSTPAAHAEAVRRRYGNDHTFAVPILATTSLAGLTDWREVPRLPFELAVFPQSMYRFLRLPVVSYALPALIAIGQLVEHHRPSWNPLRRLAVRPSLRVLERIQPSNGGFLEATPLTSFVVLSLAAIGRASDPVAQLGTEFIVNSVRPDGSWPIDSNLSVWVTTLAVNALAVAEDLECLDRRDELLGWLLAQQSQTRDRYTGAAPGAWGWSHLPGSVPDCDDTPGALLALAQLDPDAATASAVTGLEWVWQLQNTDGGWPTFCRGWGLLPFDRSGSDLTAHALRAFAAWRGNRELSADLLQRRLHKATESGLAYLARQQRPDGSWLPLWFGNQHAPDDTNPVYGTARVLAAYRDLGLTDSPECRRGVNFLLGVQNLDGGWGGAKGTPSSVEETSLAVDVLIDLAPSEMAAAVELGLEWLIARVEAGGLHDPSPIGFYFAKLWYLEKLYPIVFTVAALGRALRKRQSPSRPRDGL